MHRPHTQAELEHKQRRQRERLSQPPSVITITVALFGAIFTVHAVFGAMTALIVAAVVCSIVIHVRAQ